MKIMYETSRIILTPFNRKIANHSDYESWFYDEQVTKYNHWGLFPHSKKKEESFLDMCESGEGDLVLAIIIKLNNNEFKPDKKDLKQISFKGIPFWYHSDYKHIGNLSLQSINYIYKSAEYAITIGDKNYWGKGIGYEASLLLFYHGFNKLNLHRIWTGTAFLNIEMRNLVCKLEMEQEGILREAMYIDGQYCSIVQYAILDYQWRKICQTAKNLMI